jgi:glutathione synthase
MKFLIIGDPLYTLNAKSDTGLALLRAGLKRGHSLYWCTPSDVTWHDFEVRASASLIEECLPEEPPKPPKKSENLPIRDFDGVWIRKDPPFNMEYITLCWLLQLEENDVAILNRPSQLIRFHEKLLPLFALKEGFLTEDQLIPTHLFSSWTQQDDLVALSASEEWITKPWFGHGGQGVLMHSSLKNAFEEACKKGFPDRQLIQPFLPEVQTQGDRRVFFLDGHYRGDFLRVPPEGQFVSNLVQGGTAIKKAMSPKEEEICRGLERFFQKVDLKLAGVDLLAERVSEINITAPTGVQTLKALGGPDLAEEYLDLAERLSLT